MQNTEHESQFIALRSVGTAVADEQAVRRDTLLTILLNGVPALIVVPLVIWIALSPKRRRAQIGSTGMCLRSRWCIP